ncbi:MucB/RseB C-terminal domain-containing protein [Gilvimarinus agarilyticus]|uniref:MucB/RseB C-terminal domain-containing protein n=1 Tax=unclassified Gilvimarinus TaxID=2642066 RepID=UPI001C091FE7|nr:MULTISPECIES: MucB/RseB C-terminal domain-containing protein [unclassified Gilvimarinus]MBU2884691.1 MucB/RseB C-terminal domain-containing protein [Gilvimarinus agarilyticus]MDO6569799.1 MucB/RseB C-terminal domain-containing protein [Gilvimarinus sp. 2_MG-2023]MDO6747387.1 MucB/RseB C-terminal domain-containing protein [Gilvimarinus sp. 1_MG-2023]
MSRLAGALMLMALSIGAVQAQTTTLPDNAQQPGNTTDEVTIRSVSELLVKMSEHRRVLNYAGTFTHQDTIGTESFRLQHWVDEGTEYQRLYYLQGPEREALISKDLECRMMSDQLITHRADKLADEYSRLEQFYHFRVLGLERIAGRAATVLHIVPRDAFRFGYLFSIDRETGLVLKSTLLDNNQRPVEQFQFVELEVGVATEQFSSERGAHISHRLAAEEVAQCNPAADEQPDTWQMGWIPEGFAFSGQREVRDKVDMLMYTDGLSTFSVFLDPIAGTVAMEARAQRGATNFYLGGVSRADQLYQLTVVGEIPAAVAERVGQSIVPLDEKQPAG